MQSEAGEREGHPCAGGDPAEIPELPCELVLCKRGSEFRATIAGGEEGGDCEGCACGDSKGLGEFGRVERVGQYDANGRADQDHGDRPLRVRAEGLRKREQEREGSGDEGEREGKGVFHRGRNKRGGGVVLGGLPGM